MRGEGLPARGGASHASGSAPSLGLNHSLTGRVVHRWDVFMGQRTGPTKITHFWKGQRLQFTINTVHRIPTQIDAAGAALYLGSRASTPTFLLAPLGNILGSASSSLCILS